MKDYSISVQIDAPPEQVWAVMSDVERWHEWTPTITSVRRTNAGPFQDRRPRARSPAELPPADWIVTALARGPRIRLGEPCARRAGARPPRGRARCRRLAGDAVDPVQRLPSALSSAG